MKKNHIQLNVTNLDDRIVPTADLAAAFDTSPLGIAALRSAPPQEGVFVGHDVNPHHDAIHIGHDAMPQNLNERVAPDAIFVGEPNSPETVKAAQVMNTHPDAEMALDGSFWDVVKKTTKTVAGVIDSGIQIVIPSVPTIKVDPLAQKNSSFLQMKDLQVGDILLFDSKGVISTGIQVFTNGHYNHAAVYIGNGQIIHAVTDGVQQVDLKSYLQKETGVQRIMTVRVSELSVKEQNDMVAFLQRQVGKSYNKIGAATVMTNNRAFTGLVNIIGETNPDRPDYYCSQLVAAAYKAVNRPLAKTLEQSPGDLSELVLNGKGSNMGCLYHFQSHRNL